MAQAVGNFSSKPFQLVLDVNEIGTDVNSNTSTVQVILTIRKTAYSPSWSNNSSSWATNIAGVGYGGNFTYDFRNSDTLELWRANITIGHNDDGSGALYAGASCNAANLGGASCEMNVGLSTIPRATQPTLPEGNTVTLGSSILVRNQAASGSFTHDIYAQFGNKTVSVGGVTGDTRLTIPLDFLTEIPSADRGYGTITTFTFNADRSVRIGAKSVQFYATAGANIVPTFSDTTLAEATQAVISSGVGVYIQGLSQLSYNVTGAAGVYGSTITGYTVSVSGTSSTGQSGTIGPLTQSGTVTVTTKVTDSRNRTTTKTKNITVLAYAPPKLNAVSVQRANSSGAPAPADGTYARVNINAAVQSLKPGTTELNTLTYTINTKLKTDTAFAQKAQVKPSGISFNNYNLQAGFPVTQSYDVQVMVTDLFSTSVILLSMAAAAIFMHWDGTLGVGINKFREQGTLDVGGEIYHRFGALVEPTGMITAFAGSSAPAGWLICNGGTVSRNTYAALFALIGTTYGAGDGSTTFNVPNLKGRTIHGVDSSQTEFSGVAKTGGEKTHLLTTNEMPAHTHRVYRSSSANTQQAVPTTAGDGGGGNNRFILADGNEDLKTVSAGGGAAHNVLSPYMALNYLIKI